MLLDELRGALESDTPFKPTPALINILEEDSACSLPLSLLIFFRGLTLSLSVDAVDSITAMARSQETIANDILSLARIQLSTLEIFPVDCDLVKVSQPLLLSTFMLHD